MRILKIKKKKKNNSNNDIVVYIFPSIFINLPCMRHKSDGPMLEPCPVRHPWSAATMSSKDTHYWCGGTCSKLNRGLLPINLCVLCRKSIVTSTYLNA